MIITSGAAGENTGDAEALRFQPFSPSTSAEEEKCGKGIQECHGKRGKWGDLILISTQERPGRLTSSGRLQQDGQQADHNAEYHTAYVDVCIKFLEASLHSESADV